jgi:hypothetical protein
LKPKEKTRFEKFVFRDKNTEIICIVIAFIVARRKSNFEEWSH